MHQAFRDGFEKTGFLFVDPKGYKGILQKVRSAPKGSVPAEVTPRSIAKDLVKQRAHSSHTPGEVYADRHITEQQMRKDFPNGDRIAQPKLQELRAIWNRPRKLLGYEHAEG